MKAALLASGSKGNCCLIKHKDTQLIIDCGSTKRYLNEFFGRLQVDVANMDALLVTHTHKIMFHSLIPFVICLVMLGRIWKVKRKKRWSRSKHSG